MDSSETQIGLLSPARIETARADHSETFAQIYETYKGQVFGLCLRMTKDIFESEDLTQEVFLQVYRKVHSFRGEAAFGTWLYTVARNVVLMYMRKRSIKTVAGDVSQLEELTGIAIPGRPDRSMDPLRRLALKRAVSLLPRHRRRIFIMHDIGGFNHRELSLRLGIETGTSKSQLHHAHVSLRSEAWHSPVQQG
jgi:RNA polymerase sigma-70 factor (ECF subfamily)